MRSVAAALELFVHAPQRGIVDKSAQQLVVARTGLVCPRKQHINDAQSTACTDRLGGEPFARGNGAVERGSVLQRPDNRCADRHDAAIARPRIMDRLRG